MYIVTITEFLLYFCFCVLAGGLILYSLPESKRPDIIISKRWLLWTAAGAGVLSFAPIFHVIIIFAHNLGFWMSFTSILFTFDIGKAWLFTFAIAVLLFGLIYFNRLEKDPFLAKIGVVLFIALIVGYTKAGHAASLSPYLGFGAHFFHLLAVSVWGGCLIIAAWFSRSSRNWRTFLTWFTPMAIISVVVVIVAGFLTMAIDIGKPLDHSVASTISQYKLGVVSDYGQALLIKHILVIPLIFYAVFNGFYSRRMLKNNETHFRPLKWARIESIILFMVFAVTAFMGQQAPPHILSQSLKLNGASPLFSAVYQGKITPDMVIHYSFTGLSLAFLGLGVLFLVVTALSIIKRLPGMVSIIMSCGFLISGYLCVMLAIQ